MDGTLFQNWVVNQLIPDLTKFNKQCLVVMDNAPYYSVQLDKPLTFSSKKCQMEEWLLNHNIEFERKFLKKQLWESNLLRQIRKSVFW